MALNARLLCAIIGSMVLAGQTDKVIVQLTQEAAHPRWIETQRKAIECTLGYYERNQAYMRYDHYLAQGWPIGTGVVEGACGHLVKDRMEQAGMRWIQDTHKRFWTCAPCGSTPTGMRIGSFIGNSNMSDCMVPHLRQRHQKHRCSRWQLDAIPRILVTLKSF